MDTCVFAVIDTNLVLLAYSPSDVARSGDSDAQSHNGWRMVTTLVFFDLLKQHGLSVYCLLDEALNKLQDKNPDALSQQFIGSAVRAHNFSIVAHSHISKGNAADVDLVEMAAGVRCPLVTWEGTNKYRQTFKHTRNGTNIRGRAQARGVQVLNPAEYLQLHGVDIEQRWQAIKGAVSDPAYHAYLDMFDVQQ